MKKSILLIIAILCVVLVNAQTNLVVNPSFEDWVDNKPTGWIIPANASHASAITVFQETTITSEGSNALKVTIDDSQNPGFQQVIPITAKKTYNVSIDYYVVSGDGTDVRIWSSFKNATGFYNTAAWTAATAKDPDIQKKLQGDGTNTNNYFKIDNGTWGTYSVDFVAPEDATDFVFEVRTYKNSTAIWDNASLKEVTSGLNNVGDSKVDFYVESGKLKVNHLPTGSKIELFNVVGSRALTTEYNGVSVPLNNINKGIYIVRSGKITQKIIY